jgi:hypothetical protein
MAQAWDMPQDLGTSKGLARARRTSGSVTTQIPLTMKYDVSNTTWPRSWRLITGMKAGCIASQGPGEAGSSPMPAGL